MHDFSDMALVREYVRVNSEAAFAELVDRHIALVYSAAFRHAGIAAHAEEITQAVFIILARKAAGLRPDTILAGWLCETTRLTALSFMRGEHRRQRREQEAYMQSTLRESTDETVWNQLSPLLDEAMARLGRKDRDALVLRYFKDQNLREVAGMLNINEPAAQKRVNRALEKLRKFFLKRGVNSTTATIAGAISANSVQAAPVGLAKTISVVAVAKGTAAGTATLTLVKGALKIMAWTQMKTAVVIGVSVLLVAGTTTVTVIETQKYNDDQWDKGEVSTRILENAPHIVKIIPSKFSNNDAWASMGNGRERIYGVGNTAEELVKAVYAAESSRTIFLTTLPQGRFDFISNLTSGSGEAMKQLIKRKFGVVGKFTMVETNVLLLLVQNPNAIKLKPSTAADASAQVSFGQIFIADDDTDRLARELEINQLRSPVINKTGLTNHYVFNLKWDVNVEKVGNQFAHYPNLDELKQALADQLGLELVPTNMPIEMLVVEKVK
jgi:uncharacterized protein (TIGR03435 family)